MVNLWVGEEVHLSETEFVVDGNKQNLPKLEQTEFRIIQNKNHSEFALQRSQALSLGFGRSSNVIREVGNFIV